MKTIIFIPARKGADEIPANVEVEVLEKGSKIWIIFDKQIAGPMVDRYSINWIDKETMPQYCKTSKAPSRTSDFLEAIFIFRYLYNCRVKSHI